MITELRTDL